MDQHEQTPDMKRPRFSLSQETITILTVGAALAGLILVNLGELRAEREAMRADVRAEREAVRADARAEREAARADARADRARIEASMNQMRAEGQADREAFAKEIARILERQGTLNGLVDGLRRPIPSSEE